MCYFWCCEDVVSSGFTVRAIIAATAKIAQADAFALTDATLDKRIKNMPRVPIASTSPKRMSLAGAQHKLLVNWDGTQLSEPLGMTPSTHILKPEHLSADYPHSVINEYAMMKLAARLGLDAPAVWRHHAPWLVSLAGI